MTPSQEAAPTGVVIDLGLTPEEERDAAGQAERLLQDKLLAKILTQMQLNYTVVALQGGSPEQREMARLLVLAVDDIRASLAATLQSHQIHDDQAKRAAARE